MTLTDLEIARLRQEDGLGTAEDQRTLEEAGFDLEADRRLRSTVRAALMPHKAPSIAPHVMARIGVGDTAVAEALREQEPPSIADKVMAAVGQRGGANCDVGGALRNEAGEPRPMWGSIAHAVGAEPGIDIGAALRAGIPEEGQFKAQGWLTPRRRWAIGGATAAFAAAAALLLSVGAGSKTVAPLASAAITPILDAPVEIEALEVGAANLVQVLQFGADAPTIIFVSEDTEETE